MLSKFKIVIISGDKLKVGKSQRVGRAVKFGFLTLLQYMVVSISLKIHQSVHLDL